MCRKEFKKNTALVCRECDGLVCGRCSNSHTHGSTFTCFSRLIDILRTWKSDDFALYVLRQIQKKAVAEGDAAVVDVLDRVIQKREHV
ncbi:MAG: hypothetical protein MUP21_13400 [Dehalococcoidia bacterium]|nr:hypothetical protein [Dehalococcoidia bacterium]